MPGATRGRPSTLGIRLFAMYVMFRTLIVDGIGPNPGGSWTLCHLVPISVQFAMPEVEAF